jgi:hypothetical protein
LSGFTVQPGGILTITTGSGALGKKAVFHNDEEQKPIHRNNASLTMEFHSEYKNGDLSLRYSLTQRSSVNVRIFDLNGRVIVDKYLGPKESGSYKESIGASVLNGRKAYIAEMMAGNNKMTTRIIAVH